MKYFYRLAQLVCCALLTIGLSPISAQTLQNDSLALVDLYNDCGGTNWTGYSTWLNGPIASWEGVTVDSAMQRVTHVSFKNMDLTGTLPASLGNINEMGGKIELHDDAGLTGTFPAFIWNWTNVERFQLKRSGYTSIDTTGLSNMVNLTEFNTEANPIAGMIPAAIFTLPAMEKIYIHDCKYDQIPAEFTMASGLTRLYLNGNDLTDLPDLSAMVWGSGAKVRVQDNALTFEDLEANMVMATDPNVAEWAFSPQAMVGMDTYTYPAAGGAVSFAANVGGTANVYTWLKDGSPVGGNTPTYDIAAFDATMNSGTYRAIVQNSSVVGLDIMTGDFNLFASGSAQDSLALVDLYNNCGGTNWTGYPTWLNGPLNTWEGVTVDSAMQRVTHVSFKNMDLTGTLPSSLGNLSEMSGKIEFHDDAGLTGTFPAFIWNWTKIDRFQLKRSGYTSIDVTGLENLTSLTEFNTEANPITGMIPGVIFTLPAMEKVYLHNCEYDQVPAELTMATGFTRLYLNGNNLTDLPDMSSMVWGSGAKVRVQDNALTFEDLEANMVMDTDPNVGEWAFSPQAMVGMDSYMYPAAASPVSIPANVGGSANVYTWLKDGSPVGGNTPTYDIAAFDANMNSGSYHAIVQNSIVTGLDIMTGSTSLFASATDQDSLALVDLYNNCGGANWSGFAAWLNGPLNTWEGVTVDSASKRVTHVAFKNMDLSGSLNESLANLTEMSGKIEMHDDSLLVGELSSAIWNWVNVDRFQLKRSGITSVNTTGLENMVNLTEYNTEANPITGTVPGVIFTLPSMEKIYIHDCEYDQLPSEFTQASNLTRLYLNGNKLTDLTDISGIVWGDGAKVRFQDNQLTFEDFEPNMVLNSDTLVAEFKFSPQANVGMEMLIDLATGDTLMLDFGVGGSANAYTWIIDGAPSGTSTADYTVNGVTTADAGYYQLLVQNSIVVGLDIFSEIQQVNVDGVTDIDDLVYFDEIKVMGNPLNEQLNIESSKVIEEIRLLDLSGKVVLTETVNTRFVNVPVSQLSAGIYIVSLRSGENVHTFKVVKR
ncbi:MAG: T9SS type A sorting domain-containing protein [Bacteroidia bacterium]